MYLINRPFMHFLDIDSMLIPVFSHASCETININSNFKSLWASVSAFLLTFIFCVFELLYHRVNFVFGFSSFFLRLGIMIHDVQRERSGGGGKNRVREGERVEKIGFLACTTTWTMFVTITIVSPFITFLTIVQLPLFETFCYLEIFYETTIYRI